MSATPVTCITRFRIIFSKRRAKNAGLLLSYEKTGYNKIGPGRMGDLLDHWSVRRSKEAGADGIKILLYYTPFDPKGTNDKNGRRQQRGIQRDARTGRLCFLSDLNGDF